jgi:hypothetical protein
VSFIWSLLLNNWIARSIAAVLIGYVAVLGYGYHEKVKGRAEGSATVITESVAQGTKINEKVAKERARIKPDTAASELRQRYCDNCK